VGKFGKIDPHIHDRHHDAIEFPDGNFVLVTQLCEGQRVSVLQLPVTAPVSQPAQTTSSALAERWQPVD
jgi:hypothetical protein